MASPTVSELRRKSEAAAANFSKQLRGMEPYLDKSDAPGEWTTRQVLCHLTQLWEALEAQRRDIFGYLESLTEADLGRKAKIPLFKQFMGTDEIALPTYVGAMFDFHWNDHAGQIAKIRKANGLPDV